MSASQNSKKRMKAKNKARLLLSVSILFGFLLNGPAGCFHSESEEAYRKAEGFWQREMYGLAAQEYELFASQEPDHPKAAQSLYKAGFIYAYYLSDYPRSIQLFHRLIALYPDSPYRLQARQGLAENYATRLRQYPQAIEQYQGVIDLEEKAGRDVSPYLYEIGRCYSMMGDTKQAVEVYEKIFREARRGEFADNAAYQIGFIRYLEGDWEGAEKSFRLLLKNYPASEWTFDGMVHLVRSLRKLKKEKQAGEVLERIRKQFPDRAAEIEAE